MSAPDVEVSPRLAGLYADHHGWLRGWLRGRLGNSFDAADLAHDTFLRLLQKPREFDSFAGARAYLSTVARGLCVDLWRRREIEFAWLQALALTPPRVEPSAEDRAIVIESLCEIDAMLRKLPAKVAGAFVLAMACDMTDKEVARELGVSDRMVRKYVARAMFHCIELEARLAAGVPSVLSG